MGDNLRQDDEKGMRPEGGWRLANDKGPDEPGDENAEGHGIKYGSAHEPTPDEGIRQPANDDGSEDADKADPDKTYAGWSDVNLKQAIVPVRW
jgi:hypothetical protein